MALRFFHLNEPAFLPVAGPLQVQHEAVLIAGTRFVAAGGSFSSAWMRGYQAGPYSLELRLEPNRSNAVLHGRLRSSLKGGQVSLESEDGRVIAIASLDGSGCFELPVRTVGGYQLRVSLPGSSIMVDDFDIV